MPRIQYFFLTRFNAPLGEKKDKNGEAISTDWKNSEWLRKRIELFERYYLPSMSAQTDRDFKCLLWFDPDTPDEIMDRYRGNPRLEIIHEHFSEYFKRADLSEYLLTSRLDNDDCVVPGFVDTNRRIFRDAIGEGYHQCFIDCDGEKLDAKTGKLYPANRPIRRLSSPFLSVGERTGGALLTAMGGPHSDMIRRFSKRYPEQLVHLSGEMMYCMVIHDHNLANTILKNRVDLINYFAARNGYRSYLEIGLKFRNTFRNVICEQKESVDPDPTLKATYPQTSDEFFAMVEKKWDIIFIDGLHEKEQVLRDIQNSLAHLNEGGTIVCHDVNPNKESLLDLRYCWNAWEAFAELRRTRSDLLMHTLDFDHLGFIRPGRQDLFQGDGALTWEFLDRNRKSLMAELTAEEFLKKF